MKKIILFPLIIISLLTFSCTGGFYPLLFTSDPVDSRALPHHVLSGSDTPESAINDSTYSFLLITDMHLGNDEEDSQCADFLVKFDELLNAEDKLKPRFVISLGDNVNDGLEGQYKHFKNFQNEVISHGNAGLGISDYKFYCAIGNHDLYHNGFVYYPDYSWPGCTYYSFNVKNDPSGKGFSYYFLDSANNSIGKPQLEDFEKRLKADDAPKIVFTHCPVYNKKIVLTTQDDLFIARILSAAAKNNVKYIFEGHMHENSTWNHGPFTERVTASFLFDRIALLVTVDESSGTVVSTRDISF